MLPFFPRKYLTLRPLNHDRLNSSSIIAIDGFASTGKSTIAKMLSRHYQIPFVDSGALYRGITFFALENGFIKEEVLDEKSLHIALDVLKLRFNPHSGDLYLNDENISDKIRLPSISEYVSTIAKLPFVRDFLLQELRLMGRENGLIMDGRDIGTVVFPDADHKFFFNARPEIRAQRRFEELNSKGQKTTFEEVLNNLIHRDKIDSARDVAPLRKASDAFEVDTSDVSTDEIFALLVKKIDAK